LTSVSKSLDSKLYTKTQISESAINAAAGDRALGHLLIKSLRENATLIMTEQDVARLKKLPTQLWGIIKDDLAHKRTKWRLVPDEQWRAPEDASVEIVVEEPVESRDFGSTRTDIVNYTESAPVKLRSNIRTGVQELTSREQFWLQCLLPLIESTPPAHRKIHLVDQYAFQDVDRIVISKKGKLKESQLLDSGLLWLLSKLNTIGRGLPTKIQVRITAGESQDVDVEGIRSLLERFVNKIDTRNLEVYAHIISGREIPGRPLGFNARRLFVNDSAHFQLSHGMRDYSWPRDETALSGIFVPFSNSSLRSAIDDLRSLEQTTLQIQYAPPTTSN
jgi:hypothetical protein